MKIVVPNAEHRKDDGQVLVERRGTAGALYWFQKMAVTKVTKKRAYINRSWFALDDPMRIMKPRYLNYTTRAIPIAEVTK